MIPGPFSSKISHDEIIAKNDSICGKIGIFYKMKLVPALLSFSRSAAFHFTARALCFHDEEINGRSI